MKITVTDWAFENCIRKSANNGFIPWGKTVMTKDNDAFVFWAIECEVIRETDKAIQIQFPYGITRYGTCDIIREVDWKVWIPKNCILHTPNGTNYGYDFVNHCQFGIYPKLKVDDILLSLQDKGYTLKKKW